MADLGITAWDIARVNALPYIEGSRYVCRGTCGSEDTRGTSYYPAVIIDDMDAQETVHVAL